MSPLISEKENQELAIAVGAREDCRTFIAAQKAQSWNTTRWGFSLNLALAVAATTPPLSGARTFILILGIAATVASSMLVQLSNRRVASRRHQAALVDDWLKSRGLDSHSIAGETIPQELHSDLEELFLFCSVIGISLAMVLLSFAF